MDRRILDAFREMKRDCAQRLKVSQLAARAGLSRSRFEHLVKAETGECFNRCLRQFRLTKARSLLTDSNLSIKVVAGQCGYSSTTSFSRDFKKFLHASPAEYRRSTF